MVFSGHTFGVHIPLVQCFHRFSTLELWPWPCDPLISPHPHNTHEHKSSIVFHKHILYSSVCGLASQIWRLWTLTLNLWPQIFLSPPPHKEHCVSQRHLCCFFSLWIGIKKLMVLIEMVRQIEGTEKINKLLCLLEEEANLQIQHNWKTLTLPNLVL